MILLELDNSEIGMARHYRMRAEQLRDRLNREEVLRLVTIDLMEELPSKPLRQEAERIAIKAFNKRYGNCYAFDHLPKEERDMVPW